MSLRFSKMQGIGNDFVVIDCRGDAAPITDSLARRLADRHFGIGCDQVLSIEDSNEPDCAFRYGIWNPDGSRAAQCGNGVRCITAWLARAELIAPGPVNLQSPSGRVRCELLADGRVRVDMGAARLDLASIPFLGEGDSARVALMLGDQQIELALVSMGNPHAVLRVDSVESADVARLGSQIQAMANFPDSCNVGFMQIVDPSHIRLRVYERGVGETLACGSGACAAVVSGIRRAGLRPPVRVSLPGGALEVDWPDPTGPVWMTGPAQFVFEGEWNDD